MKNNKEVFQETGQLFADVANNKITLKEARKKLNEVGDFIKKNRKDIRNWGKWGLIAKKRNELHKFIERDDVEKFDIYAVPASSKEFYVSKNSSPEEILTIEGVDYLVIFRDNRFDIE